MNTTSTSRRSHDTHQPWRVILVGRTGLDQTLRRDPRIELIRCRDSVEAVGELSDPIDDESPAQPLVIVSPDAIDDEPRERKQFINALRMVDPAVRVLIVNEDDAAFDAVIRRDQPLDALITTIADTIAGDEPEPVSLRFIRPDDHADRPVDRKESDPDPAPTETPMAQSPVSEHPVSEHPDTEHPDTENKYQPETITDRGDTPDDDAHEPRVTVVIDNDSFEHRIQRPFEQEDPLHQQIVMGLAPGQALEPADHHPHTHSAPPVQDDEPLVRAMLRGKPILDAALQQINARLGRSDIDLVPADTPGSGLGVPVVVADKAVGILTCPDEAWLNTNGRALLASHARWLASWVKLEAQQSELRRCAFTDSLTGAWNRRYFERFLGAAIEQSRQARRPLTLMLFDIDSFKHYNDTYGHGAGDAILIETVKLLKSVIRPSDRVCRVGGDEFAVIFYEPHGPRDPGSKPLESIYQIACRFQKQICNHRFPKLGNEAMGTLTVSGGLASYPWDGHDANALLEEADRCAMESKQQGKNAITLGPGAESVCKLDR